MHDKKLPPELTLRFLPKSYQNLPANIGGTYAAQTRSNTPSRNQDSGDTQVGVLVELPKLNLFFIFLLADD